MGRYVHESRRRPRRCLVAPSLHLAICRHIRI